MNNSDNILNTDIPQEFKSKLPDDINFNDIGKINLSEAEKVANEEILFLTEADLIEGLEDFDLIPLKEEDPFIRSEKPQVALRADEPSEIRKVGGGSEIRPDEGPVKLTDEVNLREEVVPVPVNEVSIDDEVLISDGTEYSEEIHAEKVLDEHQDDAVPLDESELIVISNDIDKPMGPDTESQHSHDIYEVLPDEQVVESGSDADNEPVADHTHIEPLENDIGFDKTTEQDHTLNEDELLTADQKSETEESEILINEPVSFTVNEHHVEKTAKEFIFVDKEFESEIYSFRDKTESSEPLKETKGDIEPVSDTLFSSAILPVQNKTSDDEIPGQEFNEETPVSDPVSSETLSEELSAFEMIESGVRFADDDLLDKPRILSEGSESEGILDRLTSGMVQVFTGKPVELSESLDRGSGSFFHIDGRSALRTLENMVRDAEEEYTFTDEEIDFIHSAVISEDYASYITNIDLFYQSIGRKSVTAAVELLGLTRDEFRSYEDDLFGEEYEDVDLYQIFDFFIMDKKLKGISSSISRSYTYIQKHSDSLDDIEKRSVEEDLSTENALIFEEDIEEIRSILGDSVPEEIIRTEIHEKTISQNDFPDIDVQAEAVDGLKDITDKVIILDDEDDIDRFVGEMPDHKRGDIKRLLKYLDGLFEKLPESAVKNFASSEYFNLYVKVLDDLGV